MAKTTLSSGEAPTDAMAGASLLREGQDEMSGQSDADQGGQSYTTGSTRLRPALLIAFVAFAAVVACAAIYPTRSMDSRLSKPALRSLQDSSLCNPQADGGYSSGYPFQLAGEWEQRCHGQGANPVQAPPTETQFNGQRNWCWHWIKHKGCKDVVASLNWKEAQQKTAEMGLCPPYEEAPMESVTNADQCSDPALGQWNGEGDQQAAQAWLGENVNVYVLNLDSDTERLAQVTQNLNGVGIQFERIPGIDLRQDGGFEQAVSQGKIPGTFDPQLAEQNAGEGVMGTVGTAAAHLNAHQHVVNNGQKPLALILEDDVRLEQDFAIKLQKLLMEETPCDWQAISLKAGCPHGACVGPHLTRVQPDPNEPAERCRHGSNYGFYGMLYKVSQLQAVTGLLAQRVWDHNTPHCLDVDVALASIADQLYYYAVPFWQSPGFLSMGGYGSHRADSNGGAPAAPAQAAPAPPAPAAAQAQAQAAYAGYPGYDPSQYPAQYPGYAPAQYPAAAR